MSFTIRVTPAEVEYDKVDADWYVASFEDGLASYGDRCPLQAVFGLIKILEHGGFFDGPQIDECEINLKPQEVQL